MYISFDVSTSSIPACTSIVDFDDYEKIVSGNKWFAIRAGRDPKTLYVAAKINGKVVRLHRLIAGAKDRWTIVDHINGNGLDNRRCNLRLCTQSQNLQNRGANRDNTSGYKGVSWDKAKRKWAANITVGGKRQHLGRFARIEDAAAAYLDAARRLGGDFAPFL